MFWNESVIWDMKIMCVTSKCCVVAVSGDDAKKTKIV